MRKNISIKFFTFITITILFLSGISIFYQFYNDSKNTTEHLLEENIQHNLLDVKYFLDKNLKKHNINQIRSYLNNIVYTNQIISDLHIIDTDSKVIYTTDGDKISYHKNIKCIPIAKIVASDLFEQQCYSFKIKLFNQLTPYYYSANVYLNSHYLDSLLKDKIIKYTLFFLLYIFFFILFLWIITNKFIIAPLEALHHFANTSKRAPQPFLIQEFETIRASLKKTFQNLKEEQEELYKLSTKDPLSGLYNRLTLMKKIDQLIVSSQQQKKEFALLFLDLDNFKNINDSRGHEFGDRVLKYIADILRASIRQNDLVARIGGDEFVVVLPEIKNTKNILDVIQNIQKELMLPIEFENYKYHITCSIGVAMYPKDGTDATEILKNADIAMYKAKAVGKNNFYFFTKDLNEEVQEKVEIQRLMHSALEQDNFQLYYQPKVDIKKGKIVACEALIRLIDPKTSQIIPPDKFISIAEESNFIIPLGEWIFKEAVRQIEAWEETDFKDIKISINVSGVQFKDKTFLAKVQNILRKVDKSKLDIELTESVLMSDFDDKLQIIHNFKKMGLSLSLDDFGTGYSSLSYLKDIPFDTIKIDKSFIDEIHNQKNRSFINMIVKIAKELNLEVVAEGVEDAEQLSYLKEINCEQYQGYYCSKPLPVIEFEKLLKNHSCL